MQRTTSINGFTHILVDDDGAPIGVAKYIEEQNDIEFGVVLLFSWPAYREPEYRMTGGYNRLEVSDADRNIVQEVQLTLGHYAVLV